MGEFKSYKNLSRTDWGRDFQKDEKITRNDLEFGAMLRIADAAESMAKNFNDLIAENERLKRANKILKEENTGLHNSIRAYKGTITKVKNKNGNPKPTPL